MKKGFNSGLIKPHDPLFSELSQNIYEALIEGFGNDISDCWRSDHDIIKSELIMRSRGDLERGIELICQEV